MEEDGDLWHYEARHQDDSGQENMQECNMSRSGGPDEGREKWTHWNESGGNWYPETRGTLHGCIAGQSDNAG